MSTPWLVRFVSLCHISRSTTKSISIFWAAHSCDQERHAPPPHPSCVEPKSLPLMAHEAVRGCNVGAQPSQRVKRGRFVYHAFQIPRWV